MKTDYHRALKYFTLAVLLNGVGAFYASADVQGSGFSPSEIHHYSANGGAATVTIFVPRHPSLQHGSWTEVPGYYTEAPLPKDRWTGNYVFGDSSGYYHYPYHDNASNPKIGAGALATNTTTSTDPISHATTKTLTSLDGNGKRVVLETIKSSAPVKSYYMQNGIKMQMTKITITKTTTTNPT